MAVCFCAIGCSAQGDQGANGPQGDPGAMGAPGTMGTPGAMGAPGTPGTAGQSVAVTVEAPGAHCTYGGAMLGGHERYDLRLQRRERSPGTDISLRRCRPTTRRP